MAEEQKPVEAAGAENPQTSVNADAEKDVQNVLAELKGEETAKPAESEEKKASEPAEKKDSEPAEKKDSEANGSGAAANDEAAEEAKIVAAAAKLGEASEKKAEAPKDGGRGQHRGPRGRGGRMVNYRDNIKSDMTAGKETNDPDTIRKQVEFYFSDSNLPMDKFLLSQVGGSENRPVELSVLHSFKRMRRFQPFSAIVEALKSSEKLELTDDNTCVRRKVPLPESVNDSFDPSTVKVFEDKALHKSIYAKGFGKEEPSTQFDIEAFFAQFGSTSAIRLRRADDKTFKGSVFVEFDTEDTQKAFLALDPKPKWKGETELLIKSKKEYCDEKIKEIEAGRLQPSNKFNNRGRGGHRGRGRGDSNDNRDWRERRSDDQKKGFRSQRGNARGGGRGRGAGDGAPRRGGVIRNDRGVPIIQATTEDPDEIQDWDGTVIGRRSSKSKSKSPENKNSSTSPQTAKTTATTTATTPPSESTSGQKRAREEDAAPVSAENGEHPAKKVDVKEG